jgi:general L-amino acid transport system permease protein
VRPGLWPGRTPHRTLVLTESTAARVSLPRSFLALLRDLRFLQALAQVAFLVLLFLAGRWLVGNLLTNLEARGLDLSFGFLNRTAGFRVADEALSMGRTDTFQFAFLVGLVNSLQVVVLGLVLTTGLGAVAGVALLSSNWLLRTVFRTYVEIMRNTPLLVQLFFLYFAIILKLPSLEDRITMGPVVLSNRGLFIPAILPEAGAGVWLLFGLAGVVLAAVTYRRLLGLRISRGRETHPTLWAALPLLALPWLGWVILPGQPLSLGIPRLEGLNMAGGTRLSPEFAGILLGLVIYTAAFLADIVRAGILAVPYGQREAALATGLSRGQTLRLVVLPQALRVIIPPTTNQYLNLAKNSSLAIGVGYPDLYAVSQTIFNQSGQAVQMIALMMGTYLLLSLLISVVMNALNARMRIVEK